MKSPALVQSMKGARLAYTLGIDLGTSGVKAGLLNLSSLKLDFVASREYADSSEQVPETLVKGTVDAIREGASWLEGRGFVEAVGLSGLMHGAVLYDDRGELLGPIINWKDRRWSGAVTLGKMSALLGGRSYAELGTEISSGYTGAILFGIKESAPELFSRIAHCLLPVDFLRGRMLGINQYATDPTNAFGTGLFDTEHSRWHAELIHALQLPTEILPEVHGTSELAGPVSADFAAATGLIEGIPVIFGGGDNPISMLGSGLSGPGSPLLLNIGTAAQISKVSGQFQRFPGLDTRSFFNGNFAIVGASLAGGGSYAWLRDEIQQADGTGISYHELDALAASVPDGADGLVFCPGPTRQKLNRRRGFFGNLNRAGDRGYRARAVLEGVLMDLYESYQTLDRGEGHEYVLGAGKGLQRSPLWTQIASDLLGKPLRLTAFENAVYGAALLAAEGIGKVKGLAEAAGSIEFAAELAPDAVRSRSFREGFIPHWREVIHEAG